MKTVFTLIFICLLAPSGFSQSALVVRSDSIAFRMAMDGISVADSAVFVVRKDGLLPGSHLIDAVLNDEEQTVISSGIRLEPGTEAWFIIKCNNGECQLYPDRLLVFADEGPDTLRYKALTPATCGFAMTKAGFDRLESGLKGEVFGFRKEAEISAAFRNHCLSVKQISTLLKYIEFEDKRLQLLTDVHRFCYDPENLPQLGQLFVLQKSKEELQTIIHRHKTNN